MAVGMPININPGQTLFDLEEELARMREEAAAASKTHWGDALLAMGSTLRSFGSGGRVPDRAPEILDAAARQRREDFQQRLEAQQREQALRYISKTGNPELMAAYQSGMDPSDIIKFNFQEKMAEKERAWKLEDDESAFKRRLAEAENLQKLQLKYSPEVAKQQAELAAQASFRGMFGPDPNAPAVPVEERIPPSGIPAQLPQTADATGGIVTGFQFPQEPEMPKVRAQTVKAREMFQDPDLTDADAALLINSGSWAEAKKTHEGILDRRLRQAEIDKPREMSPEESLVTPQGEVITRMSPKAPETPANIVELQEYMKNPDMWKYAQDLARAKSGSLTPEQQIHLGAVKDAMGNTVETSLARGSEISSSEADFATMEALIDSGTLPEGINADTLLSSYIKGYSNAADTFQSVVLREAPRTRVAGSGSTSDIEYKGMVNSFPTLWQSTEGKKAVLSIMKASRAIDRERAAATREYVRDGNLDKYMSKLDALDKKSVLDGVPKDVKDLIKAEAAKVSEAEGSSLTPAAEAAGFDQSDWDVMTPEERAGFQ